MLDPHQEVQTKGGEAVTLLKTDARGLYPLVGIIHDDFDDKATSWTSLGEYIHGEKTPVDLENPSRQRVIRCWFLFAAKHQVYVFATEEEARKALKAEKEPAFALVARETIAFKGEGLDPKPGASHPESPLTQLCGKASEKVGS